MRTWVMSIVVAAALSAGACSRGNQPSARDNPNRDDSVAEKMGRAAYKATQKTKQAAKKAATELKEAGHEAHQGWNEAKEEANRKKK